MCFILRHKLCFGLWVETGPDEAAGDDARVCGCSPHHSGGGAQPDSFDMAKEGADMTEETEFMIDRNVGQETVRVESPAGNAKEMRAVMLTGFGGLNKVRVTRKAMPEPQDGEVKICVKAW